MNIADAIKTLRGFASSDQRLVGVLIAILEEFAALRIRVERLEHEVEEKEPPPWTR